MQILKELMEESRYHLRRTGKITTVTPSKQVTEQFEITNPTIKRKIMNYRINTFYDLMTFKEAGNSWNQQLLS